jgi:cytochrome c oxidase cbb3-type subunit III
MTTRTRIFILAAILAVPASGLAQSQEPAPGSTAEKLLKTPVSKLSPGAIPPPEPVASPKQHDPEAAQRGFKYFVSFNCVGCHAPNGGGGMGPALSMRPYVYGSEPADIFLTITQGRPRGMPAWGSMLSPDMIWDLVAYIQNLSASPDTSWGRTVSANSPSIQQTPAGQTSTTTPWAHTEPFKKGQKP